MKKNSEEIIEISNFQTFFEVKSFSKKYKVLLSLKNSDKSIFISITNNNIIYEKELAFKDITKDNEDFFIPFRNDIVILFKYLERLFYSKLISITSYNNNSDDYIILSICFIQNQKEKQIQIAISGNNNNKIILNENETQTTKNKNSIENIESTKDLNTNDELIKSIDVQFSNEILNNHENKKKNYDCAPVPFLSLNMPKLNLNINKDNNIFYYKKNKFDYCINLYKNIIKSKEYKEIIFKITEKDDNNIITVYNSYFNLKDFLKIYDSYYSLFNYSIDDIYDDFLIILYNKNFDIYKFKDKLRLNYMIPNIVGTYNLFYEQVIYITKFIKERTEEEINMKINDYYVQLAKFIEKEKKREKLLEKSNENIDKIEKNNGIEISDTSSFEGNKNHVNKNENILNSNLNLNEDLTLNKEAIKKIEKKENEGIISNNNGNNIQEDNSNTYKINNEITATNHTKNIGNVNDNIDIVYKKKRIRKYLAKKLKKQALTLDNFIQVGKTSKFSIYDIPTDIIDITNNKIMLNVNHIKLILHKAISGQYIMNLNKNKKKFFINLIYDIEINSLKNDIETSKQVINSIYQHIQNKKNVIFLIKTIENNIFGGFNKNGFNLNNDNNIFNYLNSDSFIFSINKMKTYDTLKDKKNNIICEEDKLPEFKRQILFDKYNIHKGGTGSKGKGYATEEDFELNFGKKKFSINRIQLINISVNN